MVRDRKREQKGAARVQRSDIQNTPLHASLGNDLSTIWAISLASVTPMLRSLELFLGLVIPQRQEVS